MLATAKTANLILRFVLELAVLVTAGTVTWQMIANPAARLAGVVLVPAALAVGWVVCVHNPQAGPALSAVAQLVALAVLTAALLRLTTPTMAAGVAAAALINAALLAAWQQ